MQKASSEQSAVDPYDLARFLTAQKRDYEVALGELKAGQKHSHWMWYVFPQIDGLGFSSTAKHYAIKSVEEAKAYLAHPVLGARLVESARAVLAIEGKTARQILGTPDDLKLKSCATLFAQISPAGSVFEELLVRYYDGDRDARTLELIGPHLSR
jgi:uncharacterized protein (DUF1810 family)